MHAIGNFLLSNGIGQNLVASALVGVPSLMLAKIKLWPRWKEHERRTKEIHATHARQPHLDSHLVARSPTPDAANGE